MNNIIFKAETINGGFIEACCVINKHDRLLLSNEAKAGFWVECKPDTLQVINKNQNAIKELSEIESDLIKMIAETGNDALMDKFLDWQDQRIRCNEAYLASLIGCAMGSQFWHDAKKELPKRTKGSYSDVDVFVCQLYKYTIGRTFNDKWVNMKNEDLTDVILWAYIPQIPKDMHCLFDCP